MLAVVPWLFSWTAVIAMLVGVSVVGQLGVPIGYHRLLTHRSFRVPKWLERSFVLMALCCAQDTPARWVSWHRKHHQHSDEQDDPHSPLVTFLWSHVGWLVFDNRETMRAGAYDKYARDVLRDPFYLYLEKHRSTAIIIYLAHAALFFLAGLVLGWAVTGQGLLGLQLGLSLLVWGVFVRTVYVWHITWAVNSLTHLFGYRNYATADHSRNNWFVALITGGEGWHNNHHQDPTSASVQHRWFEFDLNYAIIRGLMRLGLATDVVGQKHRRPGHAVAAIAPSEAPQEGQHGPSSDHRRLCAESLARSVPSTSESGATRREMIGSKSL
ncbi:MAG TPA: acyl-CoA desaturase [Pirellulales bacterium]|jgi:stearoyl-CoA desaturase (delta-9 desaturase)|nr:acyl-CoA desaturase [Pirellulales bacterium]